MRTSLCGVVLFFFALGLARGSDRTIAQFVHTAWGEKEGAPAGILALAQTTDGYLWLGTAATVVTVVVPGSIAFRRSQTERLF
jgi:ligand-binding sensor domain-containing protein